MINPPRYFETIRTQASRRWDQLERDPDLAAPWHQLFKQVQSPRHVLSELLQNADDAGASNASAKVENNEFIFEHDGVDFEEDHFASLCKFGYSNKRNLHTIGFRGIGFKSTFSLGDEVRLLTPTLSVLFNRNRFTEPVWIAHDGNIGTTQIRIPIKDNYRRQELEKNLLEWSSSPLSLLFFRNIQRLTIHGRVIHRHSVGRGPLDGAEWVKLSDEQGKPYLLIRSQAEPFPKEALEEIREERMGSAEFDLPPCQIDLVAGVEGDQRLFVVLPTGVKTKLSFTCNAPFVQDPGRLKIKDPEISPTNRWLLERAGGLAASALLAWLRREDLGLEERSRAYMLFPDIDCEDNSLEGVCATICEKAFESEIKDKEFLLTEEGRLVGIGGCFTVPSRLYDVWKPGEISKILDSKSRPLTYREIPTDALQALINWGVVDSVKKDRVLAVLESESVPRPETWRQLLLLWDFVADEVYQKRYYSTNHNTVRIFPVHEREILLPASKIVRLGEKRLLSSSEDWDFLSDYLLVLNQNWTRFLAEQRRLAEEEGNIELQGQVENAYKILSVLKMEEASDPSLVVDQVAKKFFAQKTCRLTDCVRLTHIAVTLGASVPSNFQYVTRDGERKAANQDVIADVKGDLDYFVDEKWYQRHLLHDAYRSSFTSCTETEWDQWVRSERSRLLTFLPIKPIQKQVYGRPKISRLVKDRGATFEPRFPYSTHSFKLQDWDFEREHWQYWKALASGKPDFWGELLTRILYFLRQWTEAISAGAVQVATTGNTRPIIFQELVHEWIMKFRDLPCLQDTWGRFRDPAELLRRTPETEALLDVEPFVRAEHDTEMNRPLLIKLGVRDTPTGSKGLLDRIRALSQARNAPFFEVEKWYHRLDGILLKSSTGEVQEVKNAFRNESLILTETGEWVKSGEVFLSADTGEAGAAEFAVVHHSFRDLVLWQKIGVALRPTPELVLNWLKDIPSRSKLTPDQLRRIRPLLSHYADRICQDCGHWLNLEGEWVPTGELEYRLTMQSLIPWANLFPAIKKKTADFQRLSAELCQQYPFLKLPNLSICIEEHIKEGVKDQNLTCQKPWIAALGKGISRISFDDEKEVDRIRGHAFRLAESVWQPAKGLEAEPYINGTPAGTSRKIEVLWEGRRLYVEDRQVGRLFKAMAQELARPFDRQDISDAIKACVERSPEFVTEYFEANFELLPLEMVTNKRNAINGEKEPVSPFSSPGASLPDDTTLSGGEEPEKGPSESQPTKAAGPESLPGMSEGEGDKDDISSFGRKTSPPQPLRPRFIEIYAKTQGFEKGNHGDRFNHPDGSWLQKSDRGPFTWEKYSSQGQLIQAYWVKDHCLEKEPLQLDAAIWALCQKYPDQYTLIIADLEGHPIELTGRRLEELVKSGQLKLYAAEYRLTYEDKHEY